MNKQQISTKKTQLSQDKDGTLIGSQQFLEYNGPLPHPSILKGFAEIDDSFPDRIIKMAEEHAKTEDETQRKIIQLNARSILLGQIFSFIFGLAGIGACVYLAIKGNTAGSIASVIAVIVQSVVAAISNNKK